MAKPREARCFPSAEKLRFIERLSEVVRYCFFTGLFDAKWYAKRRL